MDQHAALGAHKFNAHDCLKCAAEAIHQNNHAEDKLVLSTRMLWRRYLSTVISGACRSADRLAAAGIIEDSLCMHPDCAHKICDANHWIYECPLNTSPSRGAAENYIDDTASQQYHGQHRARATEDLYCRPCMHVCGICPDVNGFHAIPATAQEEQDKDIHSL